MQATGSAAQVWHIDLPVTSSVGSPARDRIAHAVLGLLPGLSLTV